MQSTLHSQNDQCRRLSKQPDILNIIKRRQINYFGNTAQSTKHYLLQIIFKGESDGRRGPGLRRLSWLNNLS